MTVAARLPIRGERRRREAAPPSGADLSERVEDLGVFRKAVHLVFREDLPVPGCHVEDAAARFDERRLDSELLPDLGRQTGGSRVVVSDAAVFDLYVHRGPLRRV
jgi:hypothetical protein